MHKIKPMILPSLDSQVLLLLCSHLALADDSELTPLTLREWTRRGDQQPACIHTYQTIIDSVTEDSQ